MKQLRNQGPAWLFYLVLTLAVPALCVGLAGCLGEFAPSTASEAVADAAAFALEPTAAPATPHDENMAAPQVESEAAAPQEPSTCFDCHTNKELLIDTADPEEVVISENEGEG